MSATHPGAISTLQPVRDGVYLSHHEHRWLHVGEKKWESGKTHPVFRCEVCGDVICDLWQEGGWMA